MNFDVPDKNKFELSREFVEAVERSKLEAGDKTNLLLTKAGLKPASHIFLEIGLKGKEMTEEYLTEEEVRDITSLLKKSGLEVEVGERKLFEKYKLFEESEEPETVRRIPVEYIRAFVAGSREKLEALTKVWDTRDQEAIGLALGIPRSAVEAFVGKSEPMDPKDIPEEIRNSDARLFMEATLSKENWREELKVGQERSDFIKKVSPATYKEMMETEVIELE